jgi:adenylylsulfate kinase-like enzyme
MKQIKINKNSGILFFITGLSGAGKTSISLKIKRYIIKSFGPTIIIHSEKLRKIYDFKGFSQDERTSLGSQHINLLNFILKQKINVIYDAIALSAKLRSLKRKKIKNYVEIFIKSNVNEIIKFNKKKKIYGKLKKNIVGLDIRAEFPKNPHITINNNFKKNISDIARELEKKINKIIIN